VASLSPNLEPFALPPDVLAQQKAVLLERRSQPLDGAEDVVAVLGELRPLGELVGPPYEG
jgi:hypothetical protein